jgi:exopolysaccharide production protein ExoQ
MTVRTLPIPLQSAPRPQVRGIARLFDQAVVFAGVLMLLEIIKFAITGNGEPEDLAGAGNPLARAAWYPLYLGILVVLAARIGALARAAVAAWPVFALLALTAASVAWSVAPEVTARRAVAVGFTVLFGVFLALRDDRLGTLRLVGAAILTGAALNLLVIFALPGVGVDHDLHAGAWKGVTVEKNALGGDMARAALVMLALCGLDRARRGIWLAGLAVTVLLVLGSASRTALLALLVPGALYGLYLIGRRSAVTALGVFYMATVGAVAAGAFILLAPDTAAGLIGKDLTLTGRTDIWELALAQIKAAPWTGYGFGAFWADPYGPSYAITSRLEWAVPSAHNTWLETGLALGIPGMALLAVAVGWPLLKSMLAVLGGAAPFAGLGLVQLLLFSLSESAIFWQPNALSCALFGFYAAAALQAKASVAAPPAPAPRPKLARARTA